MNDDVSFDSNEKTLVLRLHKLVLPVKSEKKVAFGGFKDTIFPFQRGKAFSPHGVSFRVKTKHSKQALESSLSSKATSDSELSFNLKSRKKKRRQKKVSRKRKARKRKPRKASSTVDSSLGREQTPQVGKAGSEKRKKRKTADSSRFKNFLQFGHDLLQSRRAEVYNDGTNCARTVNHSTVLHWAVSFGDADRQIELLTIQIVGNSDSNKFG